MMLYYQLLVLAALLGIAGLVARNLHDYRIPRADMPVPGDAPHVSILIPARNEAANIERCLAGLLTQEYPSYDITVLDDSSTDDTAERITRLQLQNERLILLAGRPLPAGWAGKAHACWQLAQQSRGEWLLFLDADTFEHAPQLLAVAVAEAQRTEADLLTTFPRQVIGSLGEALTVPMIHWILFTLLPIGRVAKDPQPALVAACGQFLLVRRDAYLKSGGHSAITASLHDGLHLARILKRSGYRVVLADLARWVSCRMYSGWAQCWAGFSRNAYQALGSLPALLLVSTLEATLFLLPPGFLVLGAASGWPVWTWVAAAQVGVLLAIHRMLRKRFGYPLLTIALHPICLAALLAIQWTSWWTGITRGTVSWKGRQV